MDLLGRSRKAREALDVALRSRDQSPRLYRGAMHAAIEHLDAALSVNHQAGAVDHDEARARVVRAAEGWKRSHNYPRVTDEHAARELFEEALDEYAAPRRGAVPAREITDQMIERGAAAMALPVERSGASFAPALSRRWREAFAAAVLRAALKAPDGE